MHEGRARAEQARDLLRAGRAEQARTLLARALQRDGADADLNGAMAAVMSGLGQHEQARYYSDRAVRARPDDPVLLRAHGTLLLAAGDTADAAAALERAVERSPDDHEARVNLAGALLMSERYAAALVHCEAARSRGFDHPYLTATLASSMRCLGRAEEALGILREAVARHPGDLLLAEALASCLNYVPSDPAEALRAHIAWARLLERQVSAAGVSLPPPASPGPGDADRRLRIGILSPDLRTHSVAFFVEPLLRHLDREGFEVVCYASGTIEDDTTARLRGLAAGWRGVAAMDDAALARQIRADRIDILIELSGLSSANRLACLCLRPAPVQATYIGYPNTTGLAAMDWRIVDAITDPPSPSADGVAATATERLVRVEGCFLCYQPPTVAAGASPPPVRGADAGGSKPITFGSFNNLQKISRGVVSAWARVLEGVPGSRLLLKSPGLREDASRRALLDRFAAEGVEPGRVEAMPPTAGMAEHLAAYSRVDIALDTFPYNGTTTTCEALYMGVPVVSLAGRTHASRVGLSLLSAVGLPELAPETEAEYIRRAVALATDHGWQASVRLGLRDRLLGSKLCDGPSYGRRIGAALRAAWRERCVGGASDKGKGVA